MPLILIFAATPACCALTLPAVYAACYAAFDVALIQAAYSTQSHGRVSPRRALLRYDIIGVLLLPLLVVYVVRADTTPLPMRKMRVALMRCCCCLLPRAPLRAAR